MFITNRMKVTAVFNLQEPGEHPRCGDGITNDSGFSYNPEDLNKSNETAVSKIDGIKFYNFYWEDWGAPDLNLMLNIVRIMDSIISQKQKVLVHCHAGMGRTGLVIGCYMLYSREYSSSQKIIELVQSKRVKAFKNSKQKNFFKLFEDLLKELRILFPTSTETKLNLIEYLEKQSYLLHGEKRRMLRKCPVLVYEIAERISLLKIRGLITEKAV